MFSPLARARSIYRVHVYSFQNLNLIILLSVHREDHQIICFHLYLSSSFSSITSTNYISFFTSFRNLLFRFFPFSPAWKLLLKHSSTRVFTILPINGVKSLLLKRSQAGALMVLVPSTMGGERGESMFQLKVEFPQFLLLILHYTLLSQTRI